MDDAGLHSSERLFHNFQGNLLLFKSKHGHKLVEEVHQLWDKNITTLGVNFMYLKGNICLFRCYETCFSEEKFSLHSKLFWLLEIFFLSFCVVSH